MTKNKWPWIMLFSRITLFFGIQAICALFFYLLGNNQPWIQSEKWWPFVVIITNLICLYLLIRLFRSEGKNYWHIYRVDKSNIKKDLILMLFITLIAIPISNLPNIFLTNLFFGEAEVVLDFLVRPLPYFAAIISMIIFPLTQGLVEIPTYFSYVMPKLEKQGFSLPFAIGIPTIFLGLQHIAVPFIFDIKYVIWRGVMFIPFALLIGIIMKYRPRLLPFLAIIHVLMDLSVGVLFLFVAY